MLEQRHSAAPFDHKGIIEEGEGSAPAASSKIRKNRTFHASSDWDSTLKLQLQRALILTLRGSRDHGSLRRLYHATI